MMGSGNVIKRLIVYVAIFMVVFLPIVFSATNDHENHLGQILESEVKIGQSLLENLGYNCGGVDGILGPKTEQALRAYEGDRREAGSRAILDTKRMYPEILINIPEYTLSLIEEGKIIKQFNIAVGTPYEQTPVGSFSVFSKIEDPTWYPGSSFYDQTPVSPGPDNPLGTRWMEFAPNYGIHGTNKDWDISYPVSGGCIRMHDIEARELYRIVPINTPVVVVYETMGIVEKTDGLYLKVFPDIYQKQTSTQERLQQLYQPFLESGYKMIQEKKMLVLEPNEAYEVKIAVKSNITPSVPADPQVKGQFSPLD